MVGERLTASAVQDFQSSDLEPWLERYRFSFNPFQQIGAAALYEGWSEATQSPFFNGGQRRGLLDQVAHSCRFANGVTVVSGPSGAGKTSLCLRLREYLREDVLLAVVDGRSLPDAQDFFQELARGFGCSTSPVAKAGEVLMALRQHLQAQDERPSVILVDDAERLDDDLLAALMSLLPGTDLNLQSFHVVLFGDEGLVTRLENYTPVEVLLQDIVIPPLTEADVGEYIAQKWQVAAESPNPFAGEKVRQVFMQSRGLPAVIDALVEQELLAGVTQVPREKNKLPVLHIVALALLAGFLLFSYLYQDSVRFYFVDFEGKSRVERTPDGSALVLEKKLTLPLQDEPESVKVPDVAESAAPAVTPAIDAGVAQTAGVADEAPAPAVATESAAEPQSGLNEAAPAAVKLPESVTAPTVSEKAPEVVVPKPVVAAPAKPVVAAPQPVVAAPKPVAPAAGNGFTADEQKLLALPGSHYVIQVMAVASKQSVASFMQQQTNRAALKMYETRRNGRPWFVLVEGDYPSGESARAAISRLPSGQKSAGPWPRPVSAVQQDIRMSRQ